MPAPARDLTESSRATSGSPRARLRSSLVVAEVALSVILLVSAGLMIRSFDRLLSQDLGFNPEKVVTMSIKLPNKRYPELSDSQRLFDQLLARVRALPAVKASGGVKGLDDARALVEAGATRIGASVGVKIAQEAAGQKSSAVAPAAY